MPRGLPDYYNPDTLVSQRLANVEEVVTAVQGIANLDNRGRTLYYTHFQEGISGWRTAKYGDGVLPVAGINQSEIEPVSLQSDAGTDSGSGGTDATRDFFLNDIRSAGVEFSIAHYNDGANLVVHFSYDNGTNLVIGKIGIDQVAKTISIWDGDTETVLCSLPTAPSTHPWLTIKLVIDFDTPAYARLLIGLKQYDISGYSIKLGSASLKGLFKALFRFTPFDDGTNVAYLGHVSFTIDEP